LNFEICTELAEMGKKNERRRLQNKQTSAAVHKNQIGHSLQPIGIIGHSDHQGTRTASGLPV
jgi:hypothetical protein